MAHIVILGAGLGGLPCAYEMKETLGNAHQISVINERDHFQFTPSNPWVAVGSRRAAQVSVPLAAALQNKGITFIHARVKTIDAQNNTLSLEQGEDLHYDYLVITTGPKLSFDEVPGSGPDGFTHSICTTEHAEQAYTHYQALLEQPGPVIVGAMPLASCFGPAYEFAFILDYHLRKKRKRAKIPITFVTSEPYIGHLGLNGVGDSKGMLESDLRNHDIQFIANARTTRVEDGKMHVEELDANGQIITNHELAFSYAMMLPAFKGIDALAQVDGLCNPRGFVLVDAFQRSPRYENIYAAGVCVAIPPVQATPVPTGAPKTGYMIESMTHAIVCNIAHALKKEEPQERASWNAICLADMGDTGAAFVALPQIAPRNVTWFKKGRWVHYSKVLFEKYFLAKMKKGITEPAFERFALKLFGIEKLQD